MKKHSYSLKAADDEIRSLVNRIAGIAGINHTIEVYAVEALVSCKTLFIEQEGGHKKPVICYNPAYLEQLEKVDPWATTACFAQEIANYYNKDWYAKYLAGFSDNTISNPLHEEICEDHFTGWVLAHEGASYMRALNLYNLDKFRAPFLFPEKNMRKRLMRNGWIKANEQLCSLPKTIAKDSTPLLTAKELEDTSGVLIGLTAIAFLASGLSILKS